MPVASWGSGPKFQEKFHKLDVRYVRYVIRDIAHKVEPSNDAAIDLTKQGGGFLTVHKENFVDMICAWGLNLPWLPGSSRDGSGLLAY